MQAQVFQKGDCQKPLGPEGEAKEKDKEIETETRNRKGVSTVAELSELELTEKLNLMGKVLSAIEEAMGIEQIVLGKENGKMMAFPRKANSTELKRLYQDPQIKPIVEEMVKIGVVNQATFDLLLRDA